MKVRRSVGALRELLMGFYISAITIVIIDQPKMISTKRCCHLVTAKWGARKEFGLPRAFPAVRPPL